MSDIRRIMAYGNNSLSKLLDKIGMGSQGVVKATTTFANKIISELSNIENDYEEGIKTGEQIKAASIILTSTIYEGIDAYKRLKVSDEQLKELQNIDLNDENAPSNIIPNDFINTIIDKATKEINKEIEKEFADKGMTDIGKKISSKLPQIMNSEESRNYTTWAMLLLTSYFARGDIADSIEEADEREERTFISVPKEDTDFSDEFREVNKSWFNLLRK